MEKPLAVSAVCTDYKLAAGEVAARTSALRKVARAVAFLTLSAMVVLLAGCGAKRDTGYRGWNGNYYGSGAPTIEQSMGALGAGLGVALGALVEFPEQLVKHVSVNTEPDPGFVDGLFNRMVRRPNVRTGGGRWGFEGNTGLEMWGGDTYPYGP